MRDHKALSTRNVSKWYLKTDEIICYRQNGRRNSFVILWFCNDIQEKKNRRTTFTIQIKEHSLSLKAKDDQTLMHLRQHMQMDPLLSTVIWYQFCVFLLKYNWKYVGGLRSFIYGLLWWIFGCCTTCQINEGKWYYYLYFARCLMYQFQSNKNLHQ